MITRTIIFYSSLLSKEVAIDIVKGLKGYVDVENYSYENQHIDMDPFHNVVYVVENKDKDFIKSVKKYAIFNAFKQNFLCILGDKKFVMNDYSFEIINYKDAKKLVLKSIETKTIF